MGKWALELPADLSLDEAARRVLEARLAVLRERLTRALRDHAADPEHVHQLRVGTRRARAALDIFAGCLSRKAYRRARKQLRRLRRTAGPARDWDVFLLDLAGSSKQTDRQRAGFDFLTGYAVDRRQRAQTDLERAHRDHPARFDRWAARLLRDVRRPRDGPVTLGAQAGAELGRLLRGLDEAAARDLEDYNHLHQVRIAGKDLRYALELFVDCFPPVFGEEYLPAFEQMQEMLGNANDSYVASRRLHELSEFLQALLPAGWKRYRARIEALRRRHEERLAEERGRFVAWWGQWQKARSGPLLAGLGQ